MNLKTNWPNWQLKEFKNKYMIDNFVKSDYRCHSDERSEEESPTCPPLGSRRARTNRDSSLVPRSE